MIAPPIDPAPTAIGYTRRVLIAAGIWLGGATALYLAARLTGAIALLLAGLMLGVFLRRLALWPRRLGLAYGWSLAFVVLALVSSVAAVAWWRGPAIAAQAIELRDEIPEMLGALRADIARQSWGPAVLDRLPKPAQLLPERRDTMGEALGVVNGVTSALGDLLVVVFTGLFVAATPGVYVRGLVLLLPRVRRARGREVLAAMEDAVGTWLVTKVIRMFFVGVLTWAGLLLLGVPLALTLAVIAGLMTFIPNFGPIVALVPALLLGFAQGASTALYVFLLYFGIQQAENYVVTPILEKRMLSLPPALTLATQVALGVIAGPLGLALATPLTAAAIVFVKRVYVEGVLGDRAVEG